MAIDRQTIEREISRLENQSQNIQNQLVAQTSATSARFLSEDLIKTNRALAELRQHRSRFLDS